MKQTAHQYREEAQIRTITKENGEIIYLLNDIASCIGYKAPHKFSGRCEYEKEKVVVHWKAGIKRGQSQMWGVTYENFLKIAEAYEFPQQIVQFVAKIESEKERVANETFQETVQIQEKRPEQNDLSKIIDELVLHLLELKKAMNT